MCEQIINQISGQLWAAFWYGAAAGVTFGGFVAYAVTHYYCTRNRRRVLTAHGMQLCTHAYCARGMGHPGPCMTYNDEVIQSRA